MSRDDVVRGIDTGDVRRLRQTLESFLDATSARCAVLLDRTGRLVTMAGEVQGFDGTAFASLAAADFAASGELAGLLGEDDFTSLYHQGVEHSMYLVDVGGWGILAALFDDDATLGMVRLKTRDVVPQFAELFSGRSERGEGERQRLETGWADEAGDQIDRLFAD